MNAYASEDVLVSNHFGQITDRRLVFYKKRTLFWDRSREDIPLNHITSVGLEKKRDIIRGAFAVLAGLFFLIFAAQTYANAGTPPAAAKPGVISFIFPPEVLRLIGTMMLFGSLIMIPCGILLLWGFPRVVISVRGYSISSSPRFPWRTSEANAFVNTLRDLLFNQA